MIAHQAQRNGTEGRKEIATYLKIGKRNFKADN